MTDHDEAPATPEQPEQPEPAPAPPAAKPARAQGRPEQLGLPADSDEEVHVRTVRPALLRAKPLTGTLLMLFPIIVLVLTLTLTSLKLSSDAVWISLVILALVCWIAWLIWWVRVRWTCSLYITNKRTIERRGLLSRSSDEVLHDHVRNINVRQGFIERIFNIGSVGISSAGQSGTEIEVDKLPDPDGIKEIIDAYRDALGRLGDDRDGE